MMELVTIGAIVAPLWLVIAYSLGFIFTMISGVAWRRKYHWRFDVRGDVIKHYFWVTVFALFPFMNMILGVVSIYETITESKWWNKPLKEKK